MELKGTVLYVQLCTYGTVPGTGTCREYTHTSNAGCKYGRSNRLNYLYLGSFLHESTYVCRINYHLNQLSQVVTVCPFSFKFFVRESAVPAIIFLKCESGRRSTNKSNCMSSCLQEELANH